MTPFSCGMWLCQVTVRLMSTPSLPARPVTGSASIQVLGRVAGRRRMAPVLHADSDTVLMDLDGFCLAVLAEGAVELPCGVRAALPQLSGTKVGDHVAVADGVLQLPGLEVLVTHIVDNTVPVLDSGTAVWGAGHLESAAGDALRSLERHLPADALPLLQEADPRAVDLLIGAGPEGTRLGDDVLCGWLAAAVATRHPALARIRTATLFGVRDSADLLGGTLLGCAARGETVPEFRALLVAWGAKDAAAAQEPLDVLLARRSSCGAGLLLGATLATAAVAGLTKGLASTG